jgi:hypothetical protein
MFLISVSEDNPHVTLGEGTCLVANATGMSRKELELKGDGEP